MRIRRMERLDLNEVMTIERETFSEPWSLQGFADTMEKKENIYLVALEDDAIAGYCGLWGVSGEGQITNVAVKKELRNRGIGEAMLKKLLEAGRMEGIKEFTLEVRESNQGAWNLYRKLGFRPAGIRKNFYKKPVENAVIMWLSNNYH